MKKIIAYCRVSTDNQKEEGTIELQVEAIKDYCKSKDLELVEVFKDEGVSGGLENRPALADLFSFLEATKDIEQVVIFKLDRLARDLYIQEHIIKKLEALNVALVSTKEPSLASDDPMRKAFRQFMGIVSELEKSFITMRLSGGRISKAKKGRYAGGGVAIGYRSESKELVISEKEAEIVKNIFKLRRSRKGLREIARTLNDKEIPTARGGKWYAGTVKYILENPIYKGVLEYSTVESKRPDLVLVAR
jgi:site-specific DNA recombinase